MLNTYIPDRNIRMIVLAVVFVLVMYGIRAFLQYFVQYYGHMMGTRIQAQMRRSTGCSSGIRTRRIRRRFPSISGDGRLQFHEFFSQFGLTNARPCSKLYTVQLPCKNLHIQDALPVCRTNMSRFYWMRPAEVGFLM